MPVQNESPGRLHEYSEWASNSMTRLYYMMTSVFSRSEVPASTDSSPNEPAVSASIPVQPTLEPSPTSIEAQQEFMEELSDFDIDENWD
ncbi:hypothetical protein [Endozoicomonas arenosclerae]|uniref:hypothetical protein n=1 Tax=Endozoicomonas arenosclerae TaxID=1633495 RepID=UPI001560D4D6|nr:hypothetical protein [Endozoicomonas arenosclerae]